MKKKSAVQQLTYHLLLVALNLFILLSCSEPEKVKLKEIVKQPELINPRSVEMIKAALMYAEANAGKVDDSLVLKEISFVRVQYAGENASRIWSDKKQWLPRADSMYNFIENAYLYGLFPGDYHFPQLRRLRVALLDSATQSDAGLWARSELILTDAFIHMARHIKLGRLERDSVSLRKDTVFDAPIAGNLMEQVKAGRAPREILEELEPKHPEYLAIRHLLPAFLDSLDQTHYTYIDFPKTDSMVFVRQLQKRLFESSFILFNSRIADTTELKTAVIKAQEYYGLKTDGKAGPLLVKALNNTGWEKFKRIAINLDRYKQLPDTLPQRYLWVNLPAFSLKVYDSGQVIMQSKVIVGQPKTRTPVLNSEVTNFITYPQWTVPMSIIFKEMLPRIQKNISYLNKENLMVVDRYDSVIDPATIDWSKLHKKNFPYLIRQREGDDNSLGLMKFNFRNKYDVYLHDTNARSLFSRNSRALSHGCVRVQEWNSLAKFLVKQDSVRYHPDTLAAWITRAEKHTVPVKIKTPVYLRYFTAEPTETGIKLFDDIYEDDKLLRNRYFTQRL
jgi:murein L,D-transpeptidase YcbB/YkuD